MQMSEAKILLLILALPFEQFEIFRVHNVYKFRRGISSWIYLFIYNLAETFGAC